MHSHERLTAWKEAYRLVLLVYRVTTAFPKHELYGLTSQIRRAAVSVVANIAEGSARRGRPEYRNFLNIALGSMAELSCLIRLARDLNYVDEQERPGLDDLLKRAGFLLWRLYDSIRKGER